MQRRLKRGFPCLSVSRCLCDLQRLATGIQKQTGEDQRVLAKPFWAQFFPTGHPLQNTCALVTIVPPVCLLADTSNNPGIWPASKVITTLGGIDPSSGGFPSRAVCESPPTETCGCGSVHYLQSVCEHKERKWTGYGGGGRPCGGLCGVAGKSYFNDLLKFSSPAPLDGTVGLVCYF